MIRWISAGLELLGLLVVPMALVVGLLEEHNAMMKELTILMVGGLIFMAGYALEKFVG